MSAHTGMHASFQQMLPRMLELTGALVSVDSGSYCKDGVDEVGRIVSNELASSGFRVERTRNEDCGDQIACDLRLGGQGRLLIVGHLDTVWPAGTARGWPFRVDGERASGPGVGDMKSCLVMAIFAIRRLLDTGFDSLESIRVLLVPDEEIGSVNSRDWIEGHARGSDWALVLEPARPGGGVVTARGTVGAFSLAAKGITAHCAHNYSAGASAVRELARKVPQLDGLSKPDRREIVNVGTFRGGSARQVVPGNASMDIDLRAPAMEQARRLVREISEIAQSPEDPRVVLELSGGITRPGYSADQNRSLFARAEAVARALDIDFFEVPPTAGGSDANIVAALGIPTLDGMGPVCRDMCSRRETIEIESLVERCALFCGLVESLAKPAV